MSGFLESHLWLRSHLNKVLQYLYSTSKAYAQPHELADLVCNLSADLRGWFQSQPLGAQFARDATAFSMSVPTMPLRKVSETLCQNKDPLTFCDYREKSHYDTSHAPFYYIAPCCTSSSTRTWSTQYDPQTHKHFAPTKHPGSSSRAATASRAPRSLYTSHASPWTLRVARWSDHIAAGVTSSFCSRHIWFWSRSNLFPLWCRSFGSWETWRISSTRLSVCSKCFPSTR